MNEDDQLEARRQSRQNLGDLDPTRHPSRRIEEQNRRHLQSVPESPLTGESVLIEAPGLKLSDVVGLATVKHALTDIVDSNRERPKNAGSWLGSVLLYGPQSCGKHFSARVVAGELNLELWSINMSAAVSVPETVERIRKAVEKNQPRKVIFLEHLDTVVGHVDQHAGALLSSLVPVLDSARETNGSIILGSAVFPWQVSPLVVRPGRLGHVLLVLPPDAPARREFLLSRLSEVTATVEAEIDWMVLHTDGYSFGDLDQLLKVARETLDTEPTLAPRDVSHAALRKARQSFSPTSADWLTHAGHHAVMNQASGLYDDLLEYFNNREKF